jgi:hypothetical protein
MTGVRAIVYRPLYRGRLVYGQTRWASRGGTKVKQDVPEAEWLTGEAPALRIVTEEAWAAAHARLDRTRQTYVVGGRLGGRPEAGIESRHLLGGFVLCGACGGSMHAITRTSRRGGPHVYYLCNGWRVNGTCSNNWSLPLPALDAAVVAALREDVLTPDLVDDVVARAAELWSERHATLDTQRRGLEAELRRVGRELGRLTEAVAGGEALPTLLDAIRARERRRADLLAPARARGWDEPDHPAGDDGGPPGDPPGAAGRLDGAPDQHPGRGPPGAPAAPGGPTRGHPAAASRRSVLRVLGHDNLRGAARGRCRRLGAPGVNRTPGPGFRKRWAR